MDLTACHATLQGGELTLENERIRRTFDWNDGLLRSRILVDKRRGTTWALGSDEPDLALPTAAAPVNGRLEANERAETAVRCAHLEAVVTVELGGLAVRRVFRIHPECPALSYELYLRGTADGDWRPEQVDAAMLGNIESAAAARQGASRAIVTDRLAHGQPHMTVRAVQFFDITDRNNNLVRATDAIPYRHDLSLTGNLLMAWTPFQEDGVFLLKEAPCSSVQLAWPGCDFVVRSGELRAVGPGVLPEDVSPDEWTRCYGVTIGVGTTPFGLLQALRTYRRRLRRHIPERDQMILVNTWGDRGQDTRIAAPFIRREIAAAARLGATHLQLDDGWQSGQSSNSAFAGGSLDGIWERDDYWEPHPERFPDGVAPLVREARDAGIELGMWFNPSKDDSYAHWRRDADVLIGLHRDCGVRTFKIDGVDIPDKRAELNLRRMFDSVIDATDGNVVFNLDVTAKRRFGYHYFCEYGNVFLENRYTDWGNYYPHWTLRNLWMLSRYVPPRDLQIEVLNLWRNEGNYPDGDPLAPARVPFDYAFAITMVAQPLLWFESSNLPEEAFEIAPLIREYRTHKQALHEGTTFPVGQEPSGTGWTGFQTLCGESDGYLLIFREQTERQTAHIPLHGVEEGQSLTLTPICGHGDALTTTAGPHASVRIALPKPFSFALYRYHGSAAE